MCQPPPEPAYGRQCALDGRPVPLPRGWGQASGGGQRRGAGPTIPPPHPGWRDLAEIEINIKNQKFLKTVFGWAQGAGPPAKGGEVGLTDHCKKACPMEGGPGASGWGTGLWRGEGKRPHRGGHGKGSQCELNLFVGGRSLPNRYLSKKYTACAKYFLCREIPRVWFAFLFFCFVLFCFGR